MSVVTGALGSLAPKLLQLLHGEYKLQKGVRKQVESLSRELDSISPFLHKISDVPWNRLDEQVKVWASEVREASYDMEDILDTFLVRVETSKDADSSGLMDKMGDLFSGLMDKMGDLFRKAKARRDIAGKIMDVTKYLEEVAARRQKYKLDEIMCKQGASASSIDPRLSAMYKEVTQLIGVNKSSDELISMLNSSRPDHVISDKKTMKVSIVGVGGLGKTTLAKAVYDMLKSQYDCGAFVSIGRDRDLVQVFKDILFHLDEKNHGEIHNTGKGIELLVHQLREFLKKKRYFIVIDDVWEVRTWEAIQLALVENNCGSKVITTTRKLDVAEQAGVVYKLKPLTYDDSSKLFYTRILGAGRKHLDNQPNDVLDKVLKKCAGIPLAIITLASLFAGKPECEWSEVYNSIGFDTKDNREVEDTMAIISFSYYDLPPHLRTCLLYLCTYPEDYEIEKDSLIWKWIAEGFINGDRGETLFELGERYFSELINRSMIQAVDEKLDDSVSACRVHDIVLDLLRKFSFEEKFVAILDGNAEAISQPCNVRRVALHNRSAEHVISKAKVVQMPKVRSYIAFGSDINNKWVHFPSFRHLRVLDLIECSFKKGCHLEHVGDLLHLRYLGISCGDRIPKLSEQITKLKLLQTLVLHGNFPVSIVLPTQLLCLRTQNIPDGIGKLTSLQQLSISSIFGDPKMFVKELGNLEELRTLLIKITRDMDKSTQRDFVVSLSNLQKIEKIVMPALNPLNADTTMWEEAGFMLPRSLHHLDMDIYFSKLPSCINPLSLPNLSYLRLRVDTMDEKDMKNLARLPALGHLILIIKSTITASFINAGGNDVCFQKLRHFVITAMVLLQQNNKEDSSISLHIWNREEGPQTLGYGKSNYNKNARSVVMPNLEVLYFDVPLRALKDKNGDCFFKKNKNGDCTDIGLEYLPSLREVIGCIDCEGVSAEEVDAALAAMRHACKVHPNHPMLYTHKFNEHMMVSTQGKENEEQQEEADMASQAVNNIDFGKLSPASS